MKRAIVLSGGGGKGAYQIGVIKGFKKLRIKYDIVTGTSVGALNGAIIAQKDYRKAVRLWKEMNFDVIFSKEDLEKYNNASTTKDMVSMFMNNILSGGMEVSNLENLLLNKIKFKKLLKSKIDFGFVVYNLSKLKGMYITKEMINKDNCVDYLIASASCYPFFRKKKISNQYFIDGGLYDNLPIDLAIELGADEIIAVNLNAPGIIRKYNGDNIINITARNKLGSFLEFDKDKSLKAIKYGYNDTLKVYKKLLGNKFAFRNVSNSSIDKYIFNISNTLNEYGLKSINNIDFFKGLDKLGYLFDFRDEKIYKIRKFIKKSIKIALSSDDISIKSFKLTENKSIIPNKISIIKFFYIQLLNKNRKEINKWNTIFKNEFVIATYLYSMVK
ncbi:MAG: patatin-like phospholipase family protein [Bacilli bacterium]|nr:patatin-like phospholipase family protein [Bacilli bacterium]